MVADLLMGQTGGRREVRKDLCVMSNFLDQSWRSSTPTPIPIGEFSETRWKSSLPDSRRLKCKPVSCASRKQIDCSVPLGPDRARRQSFLGRGSGRRTRWTRSRTHGGGTTRTPYSSSADLTPWVSPVRLDPSYAFPTSGMCCAVQLHVGGGICTQSVCV